MPPGVLLVVGSVPGTEGVVVGVDCAQTGPDSAVNASVVAVKLFKFLIYIPFDSYGVLVVPVLVPAPVPVLLLPAPVLPDPVPVVPEPVVPEPIVPVLPDPVPVDPLPELPVVPAPLPLVDPLPNPEPLPMPEPAPIEPPALPPRATFIKTCRSAALMRDIIRVKVRCSVGVRPAESDCMSERSAAEERDEPFMPPL